MKDIFVFGHRNPDTDSICSSIAYTYLKNALSTDNHYRACRIGEVSKETRFVLNYFMINEPELLDNVKTQIKDITLKDIPLVNPDISLKKAWAIMKENKATTLPVSYNGSTLDGIITIGDIATSLMDIYDNNILSEAKTPYKNILEVIEGEMVVGNENDYVYTGSVLVGAMNPETMEMFVHPKDIAILGNRLEAQLMAIEKGAQCIIVTGGTSVANSIKKMAASNNCAIVMSPHDTYRVSRFINQSIPVRHFMKTDKLFYFDTEDYVDEIKDVMVAKRFRNFPVVDEDKNYKGMLSRALLIDLSKKKVILVDHNEKSQSVEGLEEADILEIIDHHRIGDIETVGPVYFRNQPLGCTATIVTNMFRENNIEISFGIAGILCAAILSDTLMFKSPTCTSMDVNAAEFLAKRADIDLYDFAKQMFRAGSSLRGMVVEDIFYQDFKRFTAGEIKIGVGQINSLDRSDLDDIKDMIKPYMRKVKEKEGLDMVLFMLTDIINEDTELIFDGDDGGVLEKAFFTTPGPDSVMLKGVVSRKKQVIPPILAQLKN